MLGHLTNPMISNMSLLINFATFNFLWSGDMSFLLIIATVEIMTSVMKLFGFTPSPLD